MKRRQQGPGPGSVPVFRLLRGPPVGGGEMGGTGRKAGSPAGLGGAGAAAASAAHNLGVGDDAAAVGGGEGGNQFVGRSWETILKLLRT